LKNKEKRNEKAGNLVLCLIILEPKRKTKKKVRFANDVKFEKSMNASMICVIDGELSTRQYKEVQVLEHGTLQYTMGA